MLRVADTDQASHLNAWPAWLRDLWFAQPEHDAKDVRHTFQFATVQWIDGSSADFYQDFIAPGDRLLKILTLKNIG
jgi:hypothetical protein